MKKYLLLLLLLLSFNLIGMEKISEEKAQKMVTIDLIPPELLIKIFESLALDHFRRMNRKSIHYNVALWSSLPVKQFLKREFLRSIYKETMSFLATLKLVCKSFNNCTYDLIRSSTFAHFPKTRTWFMLCLRERNYDLAKYLLVHKINPNIGDEKGRTPLMIAIKYCGDREKKLVKSGLLDRLGVEHDIRATDNKGRNAMFTAIVKNHEHLVGWLIDHGIEINDLFEKNKIRESPQRSALGWAVHYQNVKLVGLFLNRGAHVNSRDSQGESIIECAKKQIQNNYPWNYDSHCILKMLKEKEEKDSELGGSCFCILF